jgi:hypothetical protein
MVRVVIIAAVFVALYLVAILVNLDTCKRGHLIDRAGLKGGAAFVCDERR